MSRRPATHNPDHAVEFANVSREFTIQHERNDSLQDWFIHRFRRDKSATEHFWALKDVSFGIKRGETVGLVGRNGAGKSTMLKLVTGILEPSAGQVRVAGRTYAMLELGAGFHPELSGRDNIYLNGSIYGFGRKTMRSKFEDIVAFAELERFIDTPVKYYSSGMFMRLGFATALNMDPQILVIDEVLSVGDVAFQRRCNDAIRDMQSKGVTILFVSHSSEQIREFCHRALLLSGGGVVADGEVEDVLTAYARLQMREQDETTAIEGAPAVQVLPGGDHARAQFSGVTLRNAAGQTTQHFAPGEAITIELATIGDATMPLDRDDPLADLPRPAPLRDDPPAANGGGGCGAGCLLPHPHAADPERRCDRRGAAARSDERRHYRHRRDPSAPRRAARPVDRGAARVADGQGGDAAWCRPGSAAARRRRPHRMGGAPRAPPPRRTMSAGERLRADWRAEAERWATVSAHLPIAVAGRLGLPLGLGRKGLRYLLRWYINPIVEQQNSFNAALLSLEALGRAREEELGREIAVLRARVADLEGRAIGPDASPGTQP